MFSATVDWQKSFFRRKMDQSPTRPSTAAPTIGNMVPSPGTDRRLVGRGLGRGLLARGGPCAPPSGLFRLASRREGLFCQRRRADATTPPVVLLSLCYNYLCLVKRSRALLASIPTRVTACIFAGSPSDPFHRRLRRIRHLLVILFMAILFGNTARARTAGSRSKKGTGSEQASENTAKNAGREAPIPLFQGAARRRGILATTKTTTAVGLLVLVVAFAVIAVAGKLLQPNDDHQSRAKVPDRVAPSQTHGVRSTGMDFSQSADAAVRKGIEWIIANHGQYPEKFYSSYLRGLYRIAADDSLARRLLRAIGQSTATAPKCTIDDLMSDPKCRNWPALKSIVLQVCRIKAAGKPYADQVDRIQKAISAHEEDFFPIRMSYSERIVAAFYLDKLGLRFRDSWQSLASVIHARAIRLGHVTLDSSETLMFAYALTHVVFTKSNYYGRYVAAAEYGSEVNAMKKYIKAALDAGPTNKNMDIGAELITALKLLGQPIDGDAPIERASDCESEF